MAERGSQPPFQHDPSSVVHWTGRQEALGDHWGTAAVIVAAAFMLRLVFYSGFFGSDEVTYTERAVAWLLGDRSIPTYVGSHRLGVTLPVAGSMTLLGVSEFAANFWSMACSLLEVVLVWVVALRLGGRSLAIPAALLLALSPLHIHYAGRLMADAPVSFFMTLSAVAVLASRRDSAVGPLLSGLAAGFVYWIKQPVVIFAVVVLALMLLDRRPLRHYLVWAAGAAGIVGLNFALMWVYAGDPFFILKVMSKSLAQVVDRVDLDKRPHAYLTWLFLDMRFTWLLGWFALVGLVLGLRDASSRMVSLRVLVWLLGLVTLFSLWPASVNPLDWIFKQPNYMTLFLAPATIAAALLLQAVGARLRATLLTVYALGGLFLASLQQADIQSFSANARAMPQLLELYPQATAYMGTTGRMAVEFDQVLSAATLETMRPTRIRPLAEAAGAAGETAAIAVFDPVSGPHRRDPATIKGWSNAPCWQPAAGVDPHPLGLAAQPSVWVVRTALGLMPAAAWRAKGAVFMTTPPAVVMRLDTACAASVRAPGRQ